MFRLQMVDLDSSTVEQVLVVCLGNCLSLLGTIYKIIMRKGTVISRDTPQGQDIFQCTSL